MGFTTGKQIYLLFNAIFWIELWSIQNCSNIEKVLDRNFEKRSHLLWVEWRISTGQIMPMCVEEILQHSLGGELIFLYLPSTNPFLVFVRFVFVSAVLFVKGDYLSWITIIFWWRGAVEGKFKGRDELLMGFQRQWQCFNGFSPPAVATTRLRKSNWSL